MRVMSYGVRVCVRDIYAQKLIGNNNNNNNTGRINCIYESDSFMRTYSFGYS